MARLNGKRRREAAQRRAATQFANALNPTSQADSGHVRNTHKVHIAAQVVPAVARAFSPKPLNWEGAGKAGKVVNGRVVPKRPAKPKTDARNLTASELQRAQFVGQRGKALPQTLEVETPED